jgi:hypothetical protein
LVESDRGHVDTGTDDVSGFASLSYKGDLAVRAPSAGVDPAESSVCLDFHVESGIVREGDLKGATVNIFADGN